MCAPQGVRACRDNMTSLGRTSRVRTATVGRFGRVEVVDAESLVPGVGVVAVCLLKFAETLSFSFVD